MCGQKGCAIFWCFLYFLSGLGLIGTGAWMAADDWIYDTAVTMRPSLMDKKVPWQGFLGGQLALGVYLFLVGILGMAGSACDLDTKVKNSLIAFAVFASIGCIATIVFSGIITAGYATADKEKILIKLKTGITENYDQTSDKIDKLTRAWNRYQIEHKCCGADNFTDYAGASLGAGNTVPWSCCKLNDGVDEDEADGDQDVDYPSCKSDATIFPAKCSLTDTDGNDLYCGGCADKHWKRYRRDMLVFMSMGWVCVFVQIVAMAVSGCLRTSAGKKYIA